MRALSIIFAAGLAVVSLLAPAQAVKIDQAGWAAKKTTISLPTGQRLAEVECGDRKGEPVILFLASHQAALREALPQAEYRKLVGLGHNLIWEKPYLPGPSLADFLAR